MSTFKEDEMTLLLKCFPLLLVLAIAMPAYANDAAFIPNATTVDTKAEPEAVPKGDVKIGGKVSLTVDPKSKTKTTKGAVPPTVDPDDPGAIFGAIVTAFKGGAWAWLIGLVLMLATLVVNKVLKEKIPKKVLPWLAIGLGVGTNIAMSFASGLYWLEALGNGITMGLAAAGGWSAVGKLIFGKKDNGVTTGSTGT